MNETMKVLLSQRSIRKFTKQEIEPEKLHEIISAAQWTATSSYFQTFTIINIK
ncbi:MAG: oxygen-insensitive NADPH nitroreductase, partial [Acholeplasmataceae bacterium]|nr:oxygen-insensitive NADPH nitroreductase [Acholeplasmataceae bacterium]